jgi:large subunit ribosomal protein L29
MKKADIKKLSDEEIEKKREEIKKELMIILTKKSSGANPDNPGKVRSMKKDMARMLTEKNRRIFEAK